VLIISLGIVAGGYVPFIFFPKGESNWVIAKVGYPLGTPFEITEKTIEHLEKQAFQLNDLFNKKLKNNGDIIVNTFALVGMDRAGPIGKKAGSFCKYCFKQMARFNWRNSKSGNADIYNF
jgi:hypothetical protein